ncbi:hypothetical protein [Paenibacillus sp. OV219]|uniref:hypothetical protein n=1 Tax=Paenibacillus sp. OV219 TaxID=1884377 RepID=UPI0008C5E3B7|nr:hypothetical protein [Paenibacillus sp. OV219]SEN04862.1 hypothetical protein SAMN05518847_10234 [Paenibacillus sp. OV219]
MDNETPTCLSRLVFDIFRNADLERRLRLTSPHEEEVCAYCGNRFDFMVPMKQLELSRYTDWHLHQVRTSESFCLPCITVLRTDDFRRKAVIAEARAVQFLTMAEPRDRESLIQSLFYSPPSTPFAISIPSDYRKHIMLRAKLNYDRSQFYVQFGEQSVLLIPDLHRNVYESVRLLKQAGISAVQIERGTYAQCYLQNNESFLSSIRPSPLLSLVLELTKSSQANSEGQGGSACQP